MTNPAGVKAAHRPAGATTDGAFYLDDGSLPGAVAARAGMHVIQPQFAGASTYDASHNVAGLRSIRLGILRR